MPNSKTHLPPSSAGYRIGAVSALSGLPVPTLRVWEIRYGTFSPQLTGGRQRLYSDDDVLRATLLKRLSGQGHAIGGIARHSADKLNALLQQQDASQQRNASKNAERQALNVAVVGLSVAARLASQKFRQVFSGNTLQVTDIFSDLDAALLATLTVPPAFLLVRANSLHALVQAQLHRLLDSMLDRSQTPRIIVLYHFGQEYQTAS